MLSRRLATLASVLFALVMPPEAAVAAGGPLVPMPSSPAPGSLAAAVDAAASSDFERAEKELSAIAGADKPAAQVALARTFMAQGKYAEALRIAQLVATSRKAESIALRAEIAFRGGRREDALTMLEQAAAETGPGGRELKLLLGEYRIAMGKRALAETPLMDIIGDYNADAIDAHDAVGLAVAGRAAYLLRAWHNSEQLFSESKRANPALVRRQLWDAEMLLEKYNPGKAEERAKEALAIAPRDADALVMMARIKLAQSYDFDAADKLIGKALASNPKHAGAHAVRAGLALRDMNLALADAAVTEGLASEPASLELLAMKAATRFLADDPAGYQAARAEALSKNPQGSGFFSIVADYAEWEHRYDDIITMMTEAVKVDPEDGKAWAQLGMMQARGGAEAAGLDSLRKAFAKDKYNVYVYNTLNLYDKQIAFDYDLVDSGPFKVRYPKAEQAVLARYVPRLLGEAFASMKARYGFVPTTPVQVELYAAREQFSVRTSGLPNIGIQGVCFGRVVAAMSPASEPFNWGDVVWHELGHVFAIQLSKNHVPRWFTEGLSEYETLARRPEWRRELDPQLYRALKRGRLPGAANMNRAFSHAKDAGDVTAAYYASSQMVVFTAERFGMPAIVRALELWGQGLRTEQVIAQAFGVPDDEYDRQYRAWQLKRLSRFDAQFIFDDAAPELADARQAVTARPGDPEAHVDLALALLNQRKVDEAVKALEAALGAGPQSKRAQFLAAKVALGKKDADRAGKHLAALQALGADGYEVRMLLADIAEAKHDKVAMRGHLEAAYAFDPAQADPLKGLYDLAKADKRDDDALTVLRRLAPLDAHDRDVWRMLMDRLVTAKAWADLRAFGEAAVFVDVHRASTHIAYAQGLAEGGEHARAVFELESALLCKAKTAEQMAAHALLAQSLKALGRGAEADAHAAESKRIELAGATTQPP